MKVPMYQMRSLGTGDYESEQNTSKDERIPRDNFSVNSTEEIKEEQHCLLDNPSYYYPSFISFPNWHPILFGSDPSSGINGLPSLDSALSTRAPHSSEAFPPDSAFSTRGPVPQKSFLSTHGPELHKSTFSTPDTVPNKSSLSTPGQVPQKSSLSTDGQVPQKSSLFKIGQFPRKSTPSAPGSISPNSIF